MGSLTSCLSIKFLLASICVPKDDSKSKHAAYQPLLQAMHGKLTRCVPEKHNEEPELPINWCQGNWR